MSEAIFFIHGMCTTGAVWRGFQDVFEARGHETRAPTLRHHTPSHEGEPDPRLATTSLSDFVDDLSAEVATFDRRPIVIGHSMGGLLAQMMAAREMARAAVLLAPAPPAGAVGFSPSALLAFSSYLWRPFPWASTYVPTAAESAFGVTNKLDADDRETLYRHRSHESGRAVWEVGFWWLDPHRTAHVSPQDVSCPLLVCAHGDDRAAPPWQVEKIAARYDQAEYRRLDGFGHWMFTEPGWETIAEEIGDWIDELGPETTAVQQAIAG